jgi:hypothetical protein
MKRMRMIILTFACILAYASATQRPTDGRLSPRLLNYQGYLTDTLGNPITNPSVSMTFAIFDAVSSGSQKWSEDQSTVSVDKGIFNVLLGGVTPVPDSVLKAGADRWLELTVNGQTLAPRTRIVSVPYAYSATYSDTALYAVNSVPDLDWTYRITDTADTTLQTGGRWGLARPGNVLFGNADSTHVNFGVACTTGYAGDNFKYNTIAGGYFNCATNRSTVGGGQFNGARGEYSTVGGGSYNTASGWTAIIAGGDHNTASNQYAFVGGGQSNTASGPLSTVGGGRYNKARGNYSVVSGGGSNNAVDSNSAIGDYSTITGGRGNIARGYSAAIGGGWGNANDGSYSTISGGYADTITSAGAYSYLFGIGSNLTQDSTFMVDLPHVRFGTEAGGYEFPYGHGSDGQVMVTDGAGQLSWGSNTDNDWTYLISDGADTTLQMGGRWGLARPGNVLFGNADSTHVNLGVASTTGANGQNNKYSTVGGGIHNTASGNYAIVGGGGDNLANDYYATVGGGYNNTAGGYYTTVAGGYQNSTGNQYSTVAGGRNNNASNLYSTVGGGSSNTSSGDYSVIAGGDRNLALGAYATVAGGQLDTSYGYGATTVGGVHNIVADSFSFAGGGSMNRAAAKYSAILGGYADTITSAGAYSYLFGIGSNLTQDSTFMVDMPYIRFGTEAAGYEFPITDGTNGQALVTNGSGQVSWATTGDNDWTISGSNMYSAVSGNVGIGTTGPLRKLSVEGADNVPALTVRGNSLNNTEWTGIELGGNQGYGAKSGILWERTASYERGTIHFANRSDAAIGDVSISDSKMVIDYSGNVGIGLTVPSAKLDIAGTVKIADGTQALGRVFTSDASGLGSWQVIPNDNDWSFRITDTADTTLQMGGRWGISRAGNTLYGNTDSTHVNLGLSSVTGRSGEDNRFCTVSGGGYNTANRDRATVSGGWYNTAGNYEATVGGGSNNKASGNQSTISGGAYNVASDDGGTIGGGYGNTAASGTGFYATVGGGQLNAAGGYMATIGGGENNTANGNFYATVGGGYSNAASGDRSTVSGGVENHVAGAYSAILGGYADTIAATGSYSYLFGINSNLTQDSTFMVDLPHIRFGTEVVGYEFPITDGTNGQALVTNGSGQVSWGTPSKHATYTPSSSSDKNGNVGDVTWDDSYVYVKTNAGWKRSALSSW